MTNKLLAIFGAGGHGKVVAETAFAAGWDEVIFYDDKFPHNKNMGNYVVIGNFKDLVSNAAQYEGVHIAIGSNAIRMNLIDQLRTRNISLPNIIHPSALISTTASLADSACIMPGVIVNAGCKIGAGVILNTAAIVEHNCKIGAGAHVSTGAHLAGGVTLGCMSWVGIGASVIQGIKIGSNAIVGAGSVVVRDVPEGVTSVGVPSKVVR